MLPGEKIRNVFRKIGFDDTQNGLRMVPTLIITLSIPLSVGAFLYIIQNKGKYDATGMTMANILLAATSIDHMIAVGGATMVYMFNSGSMKYLLQIIDKKYSSYYPSFPKKQNKIISNCIATKNNILKKTRIILTVTAIIIGCVPSLSGVYLILKEGSSNVKASDLPLPYMIAYPEKYDTIKSYIIVSILQALYILNIYTLAYLFIGSTTNSFQTIITDTKLLCINLGDIDKVVTVCEENRLTVLRGYTNYLIRCHQQIQSELRIVSKSVSWIVTLANQSLCFQICTCLYAAAEVQNTASKFIFGVLILTVAMVMFVYSRDGQEIINWGENIKISLYECSWLDKPLWFKKDLKIMMVLANVPLHIKPLGLYVLDLKSFATLLNAAYTYYNVLTTVKR